MRRRDDDRPEGHRPRSIRPDCRIAIDAGEDEGEHWRPITRADCAQVPRPCPYVGCQYHLYLEVSRVGAIKLVSDIREPWELLHSCALDIAEMGEHTYDEIAEMLTISHERVRQIEGLALIRLRRVLDRQRRKEK